MTFLAADLDRCPCCPGVPVEGDDLYITCAICAHQCIHLRTCGEICRSCSDGQLTHCILRCICRPDFWRADCILAAHQVVMGPVMGSDLSFWRTQWNGPWCMCYTKTHAELRDQLNPGTSWCSIVFEGCSMFRCDCESRWANKRPPTKSAIETVLFIGALVELICDFACE